MSSVPRVWVVTGYRAGERAQVLALAEALGWPFEVKELDYRSSAARISLFRASSLRGFRMDRSSQFNPPWPDLVITAGMRNEPACRWIREQSGGRTRIVHIGRPWARLERFDLVITTPQYRLPERANVLHNNLTLHRVTLARLQAEARRWEPRLAALPHPRIAVIAGGDSGPTTFGPRAAARLARQASAMARERGGSLMVTTSARTAPLAVEALSTGIDVPVHFYRWRRDDDDNPYFGYLALADVIIVTADSISMLTEACATGKPVYMFDADRPEKTPGRTGDGGRDFRLSGTLYRWLMRWGPARLSRDIGLVHQRLRERRHAVWLDETFPEGVPPPLRDLERALTRVRALFAGQAEPVATPESTAETAIIHRSPPRVWVLTGHKAGDNTQVVALAEALGWPFELKRFAYQSWELLSNRLLGVTLAGIDRTGSSPLEPPWPDLVITAGRRNEPVARWIQRQAGGQPRLVHVGRPWAPLDCFDLIVVTPQYFLPERLNILSIDLPLHRITQAGLEEVAARWGTRFAHLARPYWSVMLGGDSGPFVFTAEKAIRLARWLNAGVRKEGGSVLVTNSARTPESAFAAFLATLETPVSVFRWGDPAEENPYQAYLALADRLVVTGESMSMLAEAGATGQPLYIFDLSDCPAIGDGGRDDCHPWWSYRHNLRYKPLSHHLAMALAPARMRRDVSRIQERLVASGRAVWVGQEWRGGGVQQESDLERAAVRVRALFADPA